MPIPRRRRGLRKAACSSSAYTYKPEFPPRTRDPPAPSPPSASFCSLPRPLRPLALAWPGSRYLSGRTIHRRGSPCPLPAPAVQLNRGLPRAGTTPTLAHPLAHGPGAGGAQRTGPAGLAAAPEGREPSRRPGLCRRHTHVLQHALAAGAAAEPSGAEHRERSAFHGVTAPPGRRAGAKGGRGPAPGNGAPASPPPLTGPLTANGGRARTARQRRAGLGRAGAGGALPQQPPAPEPPPAPRDRGAAGEIPSWRAEARRCSRFLGASHRPPAVVGNPPPVVGAVAQAGPESGPAPTRAIGPAADTSFDCIYLCPKMMAASIFPSGRLQTPDQHL
ncbi:translation initiation factor IF-2-like [Manacus candei]|uniref:translation initiation factor IF-2-like n=1 Tax=Manacus candei TaxID=415023 RepID=UPI002226EE2A|nr:translation initiation factor IF-2-like [Manacus candei]